MAGYMARFHLGEQETKFANIIWENAPLKSAELVRLASLHMQWKKSTTYTMLRRLCQRGLFKNENTMVYVKLTKDQFYGGQSRKYVEDTYGGSLPRFIASFTGGKKLTQEQAEGLKRLLDEYEED
jgi:predicted transcriptional regulator